MRPLIAPLAAISQRRPRLPDRGDISRPAPPNLIGVNLKHHAVTNPHDMGEVARAGDDRIKAKSRHSMRPCQWSIDRTDPGSRGIRPRSQSRDRCSPKTCPRSPRARAEANFVLPEPIKRAILTSKSP